MYFNILVCDDSAANRVILRRCVDSAGLDGEYRVNDAVDGESAIQMCEALAYDFIFMDIVLPGIDGVEAARQIRMIRPDSIIVFVSAGSEGELASDALAHGVDFIQKPIDLRHTALKVRRHAEHVSQRKRLAILCDEKREELDLAARMLQTLYERASVPSPRISSFILPKGEVSGDVVLTSRSREGREYLLLADCIGHGIPAALAMVAIVPVFETLTREGRDLEALVSELDGAIRRLMPTDVFVAAALVELGSDEGQVRLALCGFPPAWFVRQGRLSRIPSENVPLGLVRMCQTPVVSTFCMAPGDALWLMSDGVTEALEEHALSEIISRSPDAIAALNDLEHAAGSVDAHDDMSAAVVTAYCCRPDPASGSVASYPRKTNAVAGDDWRLKAEYKVHLLPEDLRRPHIIQEVLNSGVACGVLPQLTPRVSVVATELFVNAVDHGLLGLPSALKRQDVQSYFDLRHQRLKELEQGSVRFGIARLVSSGKEAIGISIYDTGSGYRIPDDVAGPEDLVSPSGRGLILVRSFSLSMRVSDGGCCTEAVVAYP